MGIYFRVFFFIEFVKILPIFIFIPRIVIPNMPIFVIIEWIVNKPICFVDNVMYIIKGIKLQIVSKDIRGSKSIYITISVIEYII